jgi:hypothetical protein
MKWSILITFCHLCTLGLASVQVSICNPSTLEAYPATDIMVGMNVALVVSSDDTDLWSGGLFIEGEDRAYGTLSARAKDPNSRDWSGSHLVNAGPGAVVVEWKDSLRWGFDFYTDDLTRQSGKCFVLEYQPLKPGYCAVSFYNHGTSWTAADPNESIVFFNTATRDLLPDGIVNYADFSLFSSHWQEPNVSNDPNVFSPADFNVDGSVDLTDVCMFADFWMYGIPGWQPHQKRPYIPPVPNITYSIHDASMLSEITLTVGDSITLYIDKLSIAGEIVSFIDLEAQISDPNLGWIDNTPIDPNNPPGTGTARILAAPRDSFFDYWGPGLQQPEGVEVFAASIFSPISDGAMASFMYTATAQGDVQLYLADYVSHSRLERILIHQIAPPASMMETASSLMTGTMDSSLETASLSETTAPATETTEVVDPNELAGFLENLWNTEEQLRQEIDEPVWNEFVESVRNSEQ